MSQSPTIEKLKEATDKFFGRHWNEKALGGSPPRWSEVYELRGTMPNHDKQGVYAILKNDRVIYVGSGELGTRNKDYMQMAPGGRSFPNEKRPYEPKPAWKEKGMTAMMTLGFERDVGYLAYALEIFLIGKLEPSENTQKPWQ